MSDNTNVSDVPDWLDAQFVVRNEAGVFDMQASARKQSESYKELQRTFTQSRQEPANPEGEQPASEATPAESAKPDGEPANPIMDAMSFFDEHGKLEDKHYEQLTQAGIPKEVVDSYIAAHKTNSQSHDEQLFKTVDGWDNYKQMSAWAADNLSDAELEAFNRAVDPKAPIEGGKLAVAGLYAKYKAAVGHRPTYIGGASNDTTGVSGYASKAEMMKDMRDPRYKADPNFRNEVAKRLAVSPW